jgi:hypothetical protein
MSVLSSVLIGLTAFNAAIFAALLTLRDRPELRSRMLRGVLRTGHSHRARSPGRLAVMNATKIDIPGLFMGSGLALAWSVMKLNP